MITRLIREASSEQEIVLLLAAYVDATRLHAKLGSRATRETASTTNGIDVVKRWVGALFDELSAASTGLDDTARVVVKEALYVFGEALARLEVVASENTTECPDVDIDTREGDATCSRPDALTSHAEISRSVSSPAR